MSKSIVSSVGEFYKQSIEKTDKQAKNYTVLTEYFSDILYIWS